MSILDFSDNEALGSVISVDTTAVTIRVDDLENEHLGGPMVRNEFLG